MTTWLIDTLTTISRTDDSSLLGRLRASFDEIRNRSSMVSLVVQTNYDLTSGSVVVNLPDGNRVDHNYLFIKLDGTGNTLTITAASGQFINGSATYVLSTQYQTAHLTWVSAVNNWILL